MRRTKDLIVSVLGAALMTTEANAQQRLPAPVGATESATAETADRYGGESEPSSLRGPIHFLDWTGKTPAKPSLQRAPVQQAQDARSKAEQPQQTPGGPRFYSLHRDYGIEPDALPIPPQFFGPTADLSTPPADPSLQRTATTSGRPRYVTTAADDQSTQ